MTSFRLFMFPSRRDVSPIAPLRLDPVYIAGMTHPVVDADNGINIAAWEEGMFSIIDPYPGMGLDDDIEIFWNQESILELKVKSEQVNKRLFFFLPTDDIVAGSAECYYLVTRAGETKPDDPSAVRTLLVKLNRPAGEDVEQHLPWHSELDIVGLPEDVINNGVTSEWAAKGVPMTIKKYPDIRVRDVIWVRWGGIFLEPHVVTQAEADGSAQIVITALPGDILTAGDSTALPIRYEIHDEVWNYCEKWSKETTVLVDAGAARLDEAIFEDHDDGELHLDRLDHQATNLLINIKDADVFAAGDTITIKIIGIGAPETASRTYTRDVVLSNPPYYLDFPIPYEFVSLFARGTLDGSYVLHKQDGTPPLSSRRAFVKVIGNPALLPAPTINEVVGAILPVDSTAATVRVDYPSIAIGDTINLIWEGTKSDNTPYVHEQQQDVSKDNELAGFVNVYVQNEHILALENGSLKLYYRVYNEEADRYGISESDFLRVEVGVLRATLPAPDVEEAKDGVIDPTQVYTQAHVLVKPVNWVKGDILTYHWIGVTAYGSTRGSVPITIVSIDQTVRFRVDAKYVSANIGYPVTVRYTLKHVTTGKYSYSAPFEVMVGIPLGQLPPPTVVQAPTRTLNPMDAIDGVDIECSYATMDETLDTLALKWRGTPGPGTSEDLEKPAEVSGTVTFHLPASLVGANIRRSVDVSYDVQRYGLWTPSEVLPLTVLDFQNPENDLPRPEVPQAKGDILDLMEYVGDARVQVKPWPFIAKGQRVWIIVEALTSAGPVIIEVLKDHEIISDQQVIRGLDETLSRIELLKLLHNSPAIVKCKVIFDGSTNVGAAIEFPNLPLTIRTRYDYVTPIITLVQDSQDKEIPEAGLTYDKRVTIHGTATRGEKVEVRINDDAKGTPEVKPSGEWVCPVASLIEGLQTITVEALYDADVPISQPRTFTIGIATKPSITAVNDSKGPVGHNGKTYDTEVTVTVDADANQQVQLYDDVVAIGLPIALNNEGTGSTRLSIPARKDYSIRAKALYGDQLDSPVHFFTAKAHLSVRLTSVRHSSGELNQGGNTTDASVSLTGEVTPLYDVQIYDNNGPKHIVPAKEDGVWTTTLAIALGGHSIYAKALATGENSATRTFTRNNPIPPLNFNTSPVTLRGKTYIIPDSNVLPAFNSSNSVRHQATGGSGRITYSVTPPGYVVVDGTGLVTVRGNGTATITAKDSANQSRSYTVTVTGVVHCRGFGNENWSTANARVSGAGMRIPSYAELNEIHAAYGARWPMSNHHYWSTDSSNYWWPFSAKRTKYIASGGEGASRTSGHWADVVGIR